VINELTSLLFRTDVKARFEVALLRAFWTALRSSSSASGAAFSCS
jgi:hypothetical protein